MQITKLERKLSEFVSEWIDARWQQWSLNYDSICRDRRTDIYGLKEGGNFWIILTLLWVVILKII